MNVERGCQLAYEHAASSARASSVSRVGQARTLGQLAYRGGAHILGSDSTRSLYARSDNASRPLAARNYATAKYERALTLDRTLPARYPDVMARLRDKLRLGDDGRIPCQLDAAG